MSMRPILKPVAMIGCGDYTDSEPDRYAPAFGNYSPTTLTTYIQNHYGSSTFATDVLTRFRSLTRGQRVTFGELDVIENALKAAGSASHHLESKNGLYVDSKEYSQNSPFSVYGKVVFFVKTQVYPNGVLMMAS